MRIYHHDGSWSKPTTRHTPPVGTRLIEGDIVWEYIGQTEYRDEMTGAEVLVATSAPIGTDTVVGALKYNGSGESWVAVGFRAGVVPVPAPGAQEAQLTPYEWIPFSWTTQACGSSTSRMYDGEGRSRLSSLSAAHDLHRSTVKVRTDIGECTGVLIGARDVLTAAHCLAEKVGGLGVPTVRDVQAVCTRGNFYPGADCVWDPPGGFTVTINGAWAAGSSEAGDDFALIEWAHGASDPGSLTGGTAGVPLTSASHPTIESTRAGIYGHPRYTTPGNVCTWQIASSGQESFPPGFAFAVDPHYLLVDVWRTDHNHTATRIRTRFDQTHGQSGAPIFQCLSSPDDCEGESEALIGLQSGYNLVPTETRKTHGPHAGQMGSFVEYFTAGD